MRTQVNGQRRHLHYRQIFLSLALGICVAGPAPMLAEVPTHSLPDLNKQVARVNGTRITEGDLRIEMERLYPSNTVHGGLRPDKLKEVRSKALEELIVQELAYQQAVKTQKLVPMPEVQAEFQRLRSKYGAKAFDASLQADGLTRPQYLKKLQRQMTLERRFQEKVVLPSRADPQGVRAYYQQNIQRFQRPEQVRVRLILAAVDPQAKPEDQQKAQHRIAMVEKRLKAGEDFATIAEQDSDDMYRINGGDLGWVHRGRLEPEYEKVVFALPVGKLSEPFRTPEGYCLVKVEAHEPGRQMKFEEVSKIIQAELEKKKLNELRESWVAQVKQGAQIEILEDTPKAVAPFSLQADH
jgi:peptidyl-prolyl cis-trans isomerase C